MACDLRFLTYGIWPVACGLWLVAYCVSPMACGVLRPTADGLCRMAYGVWPTGYCGPLPMADAVWPVAYTLSCVACGVWHVIQGVWHIASGLVVCCGLIVLAAFCIYVFVARVLIMLAAFCIYVFVARAAEFGLARQWHSARRSRSSARSRQHQGRCMR